MPIRYSLFPNNVTSDPNDHRAVVQIVDSKDETDIAKAIVAGGSPFSESNILAVLGEIIGEIEREVADGSQVNLGGLLEIKPGMRGIFTSAGDNFDSSRHTLVANASAGSRVDNFVKANGTVQKDAATPPSPTPVEFRDVGSDTTNDQATPGNMAQIIGSRLKHDEAQADEGIFFMPVGGGAEEKVDNILDNKPARLSFLVPATLTAGSTYSLQVRARVDNGTTLRMGQLDATLTVV